MDATDLFDRVLAVMENALIAAAVAFGVAACPLIGWLQRRRGRRSCCTPSPLFAEAQLERLRAERERVSASAPLSAATTTPEATEPGQRRLDLLFVRVARGYDLQLALERRALSVGARLAEPLVGVRALDVGSGTGAFAHALLVRGAACVVATDRSAAMLQRAARRLEERALLRESCAPTGGACRSARHPSTS